MGYPSVHPTGVTIYDRDRAANGFTLLPTSQGALLIDMNGREVNRWAGLGGFPNKLLPGGSVFGTSGARSGKAAYQDQLDLLQVSWDGHIEWRWDHTELVDDPDGQQRYIARQHHDFQREGSPTGYYAPGLNPTVDSGNTLILVHENSYHPEISDQLLIDDKIIEVTWDGEIVWQWRGSEHFDELHFPEAAKKSLRANPSPRGEAGGDWLHTNSISTLGPNKWFDRGDQRFAPDNIILDARNANIIVIISKASGKVVWQLGPDFLDTEAHRTLGQIVGQHHCHIIPRGLPGEGNLLVFDNGGQAGYDEPNALAPDGTNAVHRDYSRVLEINPITLQIEWEYTPVEAGFIPFADGSKFYSPFISSAQRLENGNTLITEGSDGRILEVTAEHDIVWEYINPYTKEFAAGFPSNMVYRAYRSPYSWVPQIPEPHETSIERIDNSRWRVPGSSDEKLKVTEVEGIDPNAQPLAGVADDEANADHADFCVVRLDKDTLETNAANAKRPKFAL